MLAAFRHCNYVYMFVAKFNYNLMFELKLPVSVCGTHVGETKGVGMVGV
jgi:hypothetical protein